MKPVPILMYFAFNRTYTGGPRLITSLVERLDRQRWDPVFVSQVESPLTEAVRELGVTTEILPLPPLLDVYGGAAARYSPLKKLSAFRALRRYNDEVARIGRRHGVRGIWSRNVKSVAFTSSAARDLRVPLVWDIGLEPPSRGLLRVLHARALLSADVVVTEAAALPRAIFGAAMASAFRSKFVANYPGVTADRIAAASAATPAGRQDRFTVLNVATVQPRKNQMLLVDAVALLAERYPQLHVQVAGAPTDQAYHDAVQAEIRKRGLTERIELLGWRDDIPALIASARLLVSCSHDEGVPHASMEAMHAGVPAVATAVGGIPEMIDHGLNGFLARPGSAQDVAHWIAYCIDNADARAAAGEHARARVRERFSLDAWAERYDAILTRAFSAQEGSAPSRAAEVGAP